VHRKDADLVDRTEAILIGAQDPVFAAGLAFEVEHRVDQMLEQTRSGDRAVLGDVSHEERGASGALGEFHERLRAIANLGDASSVGFGVRQPHGLN